MGVAEANETKQYLTFTLDDELFALEIMKVREVLDYTTVTKVPKTPDFMRGVINLRGSVVPVIDLRLKFGMEAAKDLAGSTIIIVEVSLDSEDTVLGMLTDTVQEVFELNSNQIEPPPRIGTKLKTEFIKGMGKADEKFIIILDIDKIFSTEELILVQEVGSA